jgi:hypothetical protein
VSETSTFLEPWAFVAQGVTGAAIERPFEGVLEDPAETGLQAGGFFPPFGFKSVLFTIFTSENFKKE